MRIADFIFPRVCHLCGANLADGERFVCHACVRSMPRTLYHQRPNNPMEQRFAGLFTFERATAVFFYSRSSQLSQLVQDLKYRHFRGLARQLGRIAGDELFHTGFLSDIEAIVPVPMHWLKKSLRGYNQTEEIAAGLSETTGIPVCKDLHADRPHRTQTSLTLAQRRANTSDIFSYRPPAAAPADRHILLLDDICTTGSTLTSAAEAILAVAPDTRITLLTLGVTF